MIAPVCWLLPLLAGCGAYVDQTPSIAEIEAHEAAYTGVAVRVEGTVRDLVQRISRAGYAYEVFRLCDGTACVRIFKREHSPIADGERVAVRGVYYEAYRAGRFVYPNEIEAREILPGG